MLLLEQLIKNKFHSQCDERFQSTQCKVYEKHLTDVPPKNDPIGTRLLISFSSVPAFADQQKVALWSEMSVGHGSELERLPCISPPGGTQAGPQTQR